MASKLLPLRVRLSCSIGTASKLINFSDGGGEPSTQPFHPFLTATLFFLWAGGGGDVATVGSAVWLSSSGVRGRLDDVLDVVDQSDGPGVDLGDEGMGGGVTETDRCIVAMCIVGRWLIPRARQKEEGCMRGALTGCVGAGGMERAGVDLAVGSAVGLLSSAFAAAFFFLSLSRSFLSRFLLLRTPSSFSTSL